MLAELFESRILLMEAKEKSNCAHNAQLQAQLLTTYDCQIDHFEFRSQCTFHRQGYDAVLFLMMFCPTGSRNDRCARGRDSLIPSAIERAIDAGQA